MAHRRLTILGLILFAVISFSILTLRPLDAEDTTETDKIIAKLDNILANQDKIIQSIAVLKEDLQVIRKRL